MAAPTVRIGCAGWSFASSQAGHFGAGDSQLARYATRFDVVEINSSFYRSHRRATYARWAAAVPPGFRFSVKLPREVTHDARLERCGPALDRFADEAGGLGRKLGGLLVQLPPSLVFAPRTANTFFAMLRRRFPRTAVACEPRHASWFAPGVDALWARHAVARVAADPARVAGADVPGGAGRWHYWRLHGSPRMYYSAYGEDRLRAFAEVIRRSAKRGRPAWCIFDNTAHGFAVEDASVLQALTRP